MNLGSRRATQPRRTRGIRSLSRGAPAKDSWNPAKTRCERGTAVACRDPMRVAWGCSQQRTGSRGSQTRDPRNGGEGSERAWRGPEEATCREDPGVECFQGVFYFLMVFLIFTTLFTIRLTCLDYEACRTGTFGRTNRRVNVTDNTQRLNFCEHAWALCRHLRWLLTYMYRCRYVPYLPARNENRSRFYVPPERVLSKLQNVLYYART